MLAPPFIHAASASGEGARARTLLVRVLGLWMVGHSLPPVLAGLAAALIAVFVTYDEALAKPGVAGYLDLYIRRFMDMDLRSWVWAYGRGMLVAPIGVMLVLRRHRGPVWRRAQA